MNMIGALPRIDRELSTRDYIPGQAVPSMIRDAATGKSVVNELKWFVKPFTLVTDPVTVVLPPNDVSDPVAMLLDNKGYYEILRSSFVSEQPEGFTVTIFDPEGRPWLMNREVNVKTMCSGAGTTVSGEVFGTAGSAGRQFTWPCSFWLDPKNMSKALFVVFRNLSSSQNTIRFNMHGRRFYYFNAPEKVADRVHEIYHGRQRVMPFFYTTEKQVSLASLASDVFDIRFGDDAWTEVTKIMAVSTSDFNTLFTEKDAGNKMMELALPRDLVFGDGEFPFLLWESAMFEPNHKISLQITNLAASLNDIYITLAARRAIIDPKEDEFARP